MPQRRYASDGTPLTISRYELTDGVLTPRQRQIVGLYCSGWTARQIGQALDLSRQTINPTLRAASVRMGGLDGCIARDLLRARAIETDNFTEYEAAA